MSNSEPGRDVTLAVSDPRTVRLGEALQRRLASTVVGVVLTRPGDEGLLVGGTMAMLASIGIKVHVLAVTLGQAGVPGHGPDEAGRLRWKELQEACDVLSVASAETLERMERKVVADLALEAEITAWALDRGITLLLTHHPGDSDRDCRQVSVAVLNSQSASGKPLLAYVDTVRATGPRSDVSLDIGPWWTGKTEAVLKHVSQEQRLAYHARVVSERTGLNAGTAYAEAFTAAGENRAEALKLLVLLEFAANSLW
jgi:LmbE family N-acetylglucosaminyl deacetylase